MTWRELIEGDAAVGAVGDGFRACGAILLRDCPAQRLTPPSVLWGVMAELFELDRELLLAYSCTDLMNEGGYIDSGLHRSSPLPQGWHVVSESRPASGRGRPPWVWPGEVPRLRSVLVPYCAQLTATADAVLAAVARLYGRPPDHFAGLRFGGDYDVLRLLHYLRDSGGSPFAMAPHRDLSLISLFPPSTDPGLEIQAVPELWQAVDVPDDALLVGVGGALSTLTERQIPELYHRVRGLEGVPERYSASYFVNPRPDAAFMPLWESHPEASQRPGQFEAWFREHTGKRWSEVSSGRTVRDGGGRAAGDGDGEPA